MGIAANRGPEPSSVMPHEPFHDRNIVNLRLINRRFRIEYVRDRFDERYELSGIISLPQVIGLFLALVASRPTQHKCWNYRIHTGDSVYRLIERKTPTRPSLLPDLRPDPSNFQIFLTDPDDHQFALASVGLAIAGFFQPKNGT